MSTRLKRNLALLRALEQAPARQRRALLSTSKSDLVLAIAEIISNVLQGNVKLNKRQRLRLQRYRKLLRQIASKKVKAADKRSLLVQRGGFLSVLLGPALAVVASLVGKLIK